MRTQQTYNEAWMPIEDAVGEWAFAYKREHGGPTPVIGMNSHQLYQVWRRTNRPNVMGGGTEPCYFTTITFAGMTRLVEDNVCEDNQFSVEIPDE